MSGNGNYGQMSRAGPKEQKGAANLDTGQKIKNIVGRTKAKYILHDPEAQREEVFGLNRKLEDLKRTNGDLTYKLGALEKENVDYERIIQENECFWNLGASSKTEVSNYL